LNRNVPDSFGNETCSVEVRGFRISETTLHAGAKIEAHSHEAAQICFVLEGEYVEELPDGARALRAGWMHTRAAGVRHADVVGDDDVLALLISVDGDRVDTRQPQRAFGDLLANLQAEMRRDDAATSLALEGLALLTVARVQRLACPQPAWLREAAHIVEQRWNDRLSLASVAREVGVDPTKLAIAFRRVHGSSVGERIRALRVAHARRDLSATRIPIAEIAYRCGFHDQAHFTRVFRDATGETPALYRSKSSK
jgi:AraC family transcriptional regulator